MLYASLLFSIQNTIQDPPNKQHSSTCKRTFNFNNLPVILDVLARYIPIIIKPQQSHPISQPIIAYVPRYLDTIGILNMDPLKRNKTTFSSLTTHWNNRSLSSIVSDAATFHSAQGQLPSPAMELCRLQTASPSPLAPSQINTAEINKFESTQMSRQDSGFSDGVSSGRTSTSSARRHRQSNSTTISRPSAKRAARSHPIPTRHSTSSSRPHVRTRHTTYATQISQSSNQFFHFPSLPPPAPVDQAPEPVSAPAPPVTCQYWTSDSTRRLEYAAIDAASRGVKGFFIKMVPDCILPLEKRRPRFHEDDGSDAGSVRRYRLELPEEKGNVKPPGFLKRWASFGRAGSS